MTQPAQSADAERSIRLFKQAESVANIGHWEANMTTGDIYWSDQIYHIHGVKKGEYVPSLESAISFYHPDDRPKVEDYVAKASQDGQGFEFVLRIVQPGGDMRYVFSLAKTETNESGHVILFGVFQDVTEQHSLRDAYIRLQQRSKAEQARQEELLQMCIKNTPVAVAMFDKNMRYLACSDRWLEDYNLQHVDDIIGKDHYELVPRLKDDFPTLVKMHERCLDGEAIISDEDCIGEEAGELVYIRYAMHPWYDSDGRVAGMVKFRENVTEQALYRQRQEQKLDVLTRSNADLERFAYVCSHDLQQPVRTMESYAQLLMDQLPDNIDDKCKQYLQFIYESAHQSRQLINDVLEFSRLETETVLLQDVDLNAMMALISEAFTPAMKALNGSIIYHDLPTIRGSRSLLHQLFTNLINNGLKFHRQGVAPEIRVACHETPDHWEFSVIDNGIGIDDKYRSDIFKIFTRLNAHHEYPGSGIGLSVCKKVVDYYRGRIWCESTPGKGSTFFIAIPKHSEE